MAGLKQRSIAAARETYRWIEHRLGLIEPLEKAAAHPTPASNASWLYVFGSAATVLLLMQVMTGILLALVYSPSANEAWGSLQVLNHNIALGWYLRALHGWGSDFMIAIVLIHMVQVFLFGAYKFPRELTWIIGVAASSAHPRHGLHRPGAAFRSGRLLGSRHRRIHRQPRSVYRRASRPPDPRRPNHRRRDPLALLHLACFSSFPVSCSAGSPSISG